METTIEKKYSQAGGFVFKYYLFSFHLSSSAHLGGILYLHLPLDGIASAGTFRLLRTLADGDPCPHRLRAQSEF